MRHLAGTVLLLAICVALPAGAVFAGEAPFGDKVSASIVNYNRASPVLGSAGNLLQGGVAEAKALGFATIIDLRGPDEGVAQEQAQAAEAGIAYHNIAVTTKTPTAEQVAAFAVLVEEAANQPVLFHCVSGNRAGAMWALYRASKGVPSEIAVEEGRTLGLTGSREDAVRERLGLPVGAK